MTQRTTRDVCEAGSKVELQLEESIDELQGKEIPTFLLFAKQQTSCRLLKTVKMTFVANHMLVVNKLSTIIVLSINSSILQYLLLLHLKFRQLILNNNV